MRAVLLLLVIIASSEATRADHLTPAGSGFSVDFPGKPKEATHPTKTPIGELKVYTATYATPDGSVYLVSSTEFPAAAVRAEDHARLLDGVREGLKGKDGKLVSEKDVRLGGEAGREVVIDKGKQQTRFRAVVKGRRLYQVAVVGTGGFVTSPDATAFLDSFELTK